MNGIRYYRLKKRMSKKDLAKKSGICPMTISKLEKAEEIRASCLRLYDIACALGVTMDELLMDYPDELITPSDRKAYPQHTGRATNCVSNYRLAHNLSHEELGRRLGNRTRALSQVACKQEEGKPKHIQALAVWEGVSMEEFCRQYATPEAAAETVRTGEKPV